MSADYSDERITVPVFGKYEARVWYGVNRLVDENGVVVFEWNTQDDEHPCHAFIRLLETLDGKL